jgi:hypothetical protein
VKNKIPAAAKESPGNADPKLATTSTSQASRTDETPEAKGLYNYLLVAAFIVMIVWLLIVAFGKSLLRL